MYIARISILFAVIVASGALGGYAGYLLSPPTKEQLTDGRSYGWWICRALVLGVVAALIVPLFLTFFSGVTNSRSDLIDQLLGGDDKPRLWFVFAGLCLIVASSAQRFMAMMMDTVLKRMEHEIKATKQEVKKTKEHVDDLEGDFKEELKEDIGKADGQAIAARIDLSEEEWQALHAMNALAEQGVRRPSPEDIALQIAMNENKSIDIGRTKELIRSLERKKLVQQREKGPDGLTERWRVRTRGKALLAQRAEKSVVEPKAAETPKE